jgi:hypothetical protein
MVIARDRRLNLFPTTLSTVVHVCRVPSISPVYECLQTSFQRSTDIHSCLGSLTLRHAISEDPSEQICTGKVPPHGLMAQRWDVQQIRGSCSPSPRRTGSSASCPELRGPFPHILLRIARSESNLYVWHASFTQSVESVAEARSSDHQPFGGTASKTYRCSLEIAWHDPLIFKRKAKKPLRDASGTSGSRRRYASRWCPVLPI